MLNPKGLFPFFKTTSWKQKKIEILIPLEERERACSQSNTRERRSMSPVNSPYWFQYNPFNVNSENLGCIKTLPPTYWGIHFTLRALKFFCLHFAFDKQHWFKKFLQLALTNQRTDVVILANHVQTQTNHDDLGQATFQSFQCTGYLFPAICTGNRFPRALHQLHVFWRFALVTCIFVHVTVVHGIWMILVAFPGVEVNTIYYTF